MNQTNSQAKITNGPGQDEISADISDKVGIFMACLCCIHCLALPVFYLVVPHLGLLQLEGQTYLELNRLVQNWLSHSHVGHFHLSFHLLMFAIVAPVALYSLGSKIKVHGDKWPLLLGLVSLSLLLSSIVIIDFLHLSSVTLETSLTVTGSILLLIAHVLNIKACQCKHCHHS